MRLCGPTTIFYPPLQASEAGLISAEIRQDDTSDFGLESSNPAAFSRSIYLQMGTRAILTEHRAYRFGDSPCEANNRQWDTRTETRARGRNLYGACALVRLSGMRLPRALDGPAFQNVLGHLAGKTRGTASFTRGMELHDPVSPRV